ncbi:hypothetical protein [Burkholderia oklahomensis]|uniref:Uncharacterized protein n=1 Tax=Burkholderia oklahomensis TaxID=342113 RepID=A0AAI8FN63_9BURK|nr:hypothetical protein DM82_3466 [Burkholderia oklahomensis]AOI43840.1 hypothetical protein WG70_30780 [Burkholderia oklahomensis EO147]KUY49481.1 hypothetical protein WG70_20825 [Burkholderia oklahomensis EO147]QPS39127.1 hypothetical protein I6G57_07195 [Burkholderia oklahomensis]
MSAWLTKQINDVATPAGIATPAIRSQVLEALQEIDARIAELNRSLQEKYHVAPGRELVKFYMKGGNAFECIRDPLGEAAMRNGGGMSDWDTQIIVDPWAPVPLQAIIYGLLEELVTDTMIQAGVDIALAAGDFADETVARWTTRRADLNGVNYSAYALEYDDPQSLRQVFDQQRLGLWTNDRRRVSAPDIDHPERIPGILLNDAIRPFILHRLGYTWHANLPPPLPLAALSAQPPIRLPAKLPKPFPQMKADIRKPLLMELIDVTLPRRDTIEAVAVWEELAQKHIAIEEMTVSVKSPDADIAEAKPTDDIARVKLPLPDIMYHLREIATMLCEIADGSSRHPDKLERRFERFKKIWVLGGQEQIRHILSKMAGVADIDANPPAHMENVTQCIEKYGGDLKDAILGDEDAAFTPARRLMDWIAQRTAEQDHSFTKNGLVSLSWLKDFDRGRNELREIVDEVAKGVPDVVEGALEAAYSDDLVLIRFLEENEYLTPRQIGLSGVFRAAVIRVRTPMQVDALGTLFLARFGLHFDGPKSAEAEHSVRYRAYGVPRATGITHELTMVAFDKGKATTYLSITTATPGEAPFRRDAVNPYVNFASLPEIAAQRKIAAALIEDYLIRNVISRQYEALKTLLPVV